MHCPQCKSELTSCEYEGEPIHTCDACGGEFIGSVQLGQIVRKREMEFSEELKAALKDQAPSFGMSQSEMVCAVECPNCDEKMQVVNYAGDSGVYINRCEKCNGFWLDQQELEKIQVLMEKWADEAPQELQDLSADLEDARKTAASKSKCSFSASRFSFVNAVINRFINAA